jgi:hypothetical protein
MERPWVRDSWLFFQIPKKIGLSFQETSKKNKEPRKKMRQSRRRKKVEKEMTEEGRRGWEDCLY